MAARTSKAKTETAAVEPAEETIVTETAVDPAPRRARIDLDPSALGIGEIEDTEEPVSRVRGPRAGAGIPEDHPLYVAVKDSFENGKTKTIRTSNGEDVVKVLLRIANQLGVGLDKSATEDSVTFAARPRRARAAGVIEERAEA